MLSILPRESGRTINNHRSKVLPRQALSQDEPSKVRPTGIELRTAAVNGNRSDDPPHSTCPQYEIPGRGHNDSKATHLTDYLGFEEDRKIPVLGTETVIQRGNIAKQAGNRARLDRHCRCIKLFKLSFQPRICRKGNENQYPSAMPSFRGSEPPTRTPFSSSI